jgi:hypothetical protein
MVRVRFEDAHSGLNCGRLIREHGERFNFTTRKETPPLVNENHLTADLFASLEERNGMTEILIGAVFVCTALVLLVGWIAVQRNGGFSCLADRVTLVVFDYLLRTQHGPYVVAFISKSVQLEAALEKEQGRCNRLINENWQSKREIARLRSDLIRVQWERIQQDSKHNECRRGSSENLAIVPTPEKPGRVSSTEQLAQDGASWMNHTGE